jgi:hypothetical protein
MAGRRYYLADEGCQILIHNDLFRKIAGYSTRGPEWMNGESHRVFSTTFKIFLFWMVLAQVCTGSSSAEHPAVTDSRNEQPGLQRIAVGEAVAEQLPRIFASDAGPYAMGQAGDWRLSNEFIRLTFASIDNRPSTTSTPLSGEMNLLRPQDRVPGALIDISLDGYPLDLLGSYTQGIGIKSDDIVIDYDEVSIVSDDKSVGLRFRGSPFENSFVRIETIYRIQEKSHRVRIETRFLDIHDGMKMPAVSDVASWGESRLYLGKSSFIVSEKSKVYPNKDNEEFNQLFCNWGRMSVVVAPVEGGMKGRLRGRPSESRVFLEDPLTTSTQATRVLERDMWISHGHYSDVYEHYLKDRNIDYGTVTGHVTYKVDGKPVPRCIVEALYLKDPASGRRPEAWMVTRADAEGRYRMTLPRNVYVIRHRSVTQDLAPHGLLIQSADLLHRRKAVENLEVIAEPGLEVKVVDAETSRPIAARIRVKAIYPTPSVNFGPPLSAGAYFDVCYIPPEGRMIPLPTGDWTIEIYHGIEYDRTRVDILMEAHKKKSLWVPLFRNNPTPGWTSVEAGVRTTATPGNMVSPKDISLMAAAEGVDWLITGDFETLTDLAPAIAELGLEEHVRSLMGFRTVHPKFPEWGQFFLYPVGPGAPAPSQARQHWVHTESAEAFLTVLRSQYPDAIIQSDLPYTHTGKGYFSRGDENPYRVAYTTPPGVDTSIDAVALMQGRGTNDLKEIQGFWFYNWIDDRIYIPGAVPTGQTVFGSEPGYPRMLVFIGKDDLRQIEPGGLISAIRDIKIQMTTGPFIDFKIGQAIAGDWVPLDPGLTTRLRITAPNWAEINHFIYEKEGKLQDGSMTHPSSSQNQRYPNPENTSAQYEVRTLKEFQIVDFKDTLFGISTYGTKPIHDVVYPIHPSRPVRAMSWIAPILIDFNGNGRFDRLSTPVDIGK